MGSLPASLIASDDTRTRRSLSTAPAAPKAAGISAGRSGVPVARITVPAQPAWSEARSAAIDDGLSFSPWHGLAAHRPLGAVNRARKSAYEMSAKFRGDFNRCPIHEPRALDPLPA